MDFSDNANNEDPACQCRRHKRLGFDPWAWKIPWRKDWQSTLVFLPENPVDRGSRWTIVHRVAMNQTQLKWLSVHTGIIKVHSSYSAFSLVKDILIYSHCVINYASLTYKGLLATIPDSWAQSESWALREQKSLNCHIGFQAKLQSVGSSMGKSPRTKSSRRGYGCRSGTFFGSFSWIIFQNLEFSLWPQAASSGSLAGFQPGRRLPPCPTGPFGFLMYVHHSKWSKPKASFIKDEPEVIFEVVWYISHYVRKRRFIILEDKPFSWSYSGLTVSGGWNKRSIRSCDLWRKLGWNTSC